MADQHPDIVQLRREIDDLESDLAVNPDDLNVRIELARKISQFLDNSYEESLAERLRELLLQIPQNVERVYWARAYVAWLDGLYEEAANWYIKYFDHYYPQNDPPSPSEFVYQFGIMYDYRCSLQWSELETIFTQRWPEIFGTYIIQGWNYLFKGDSESAQIAFSKVTNDSEEAWIAHFGLGVTYANEKNGKAAVKCFEKALLSSEWAQKFFSLRYQYAWSLIDVKDYQKAEDQFRIMLSIYGDQPDILDLLGYCLYKQKKYDEAIAVFGKTSELWDPQVYKGYSPYWTLARVFCRLKRYDDAIETLKHIGKDGKILKSALTEIQRIEKLKAKTSQSGLATEDEDQALDEFVETFSERLDDVRNSRGLLRYTVRRYLIRLLKSESIEAKHSVICT